MKKLLATLCLLALMQVQASKKVKKVIKDPFHIRLLVFIGCASMPETALDPHNKQVIKKPSNK